MIRHEIHTGPFRFEAGGFLEDLTVVFHTSAHRCGKVIWICHALTANSDPEMWWPQMVGPGKTIDTDRNYVVCVNVPGSAYGTSGPASVNPSTGKPWLLDFPAITIRDMVAVFIRVCERLDIGKIDLLVGSSIGGFQAIEWVVTEPERFEEAVFIATAPRISPWATACSETQRMALEADPSFRAARDIRGGAAGLRCARAQALLTYRSFDGYGRTQNEPDEDCLFAGRAASYERYQGEKLVRRGFDAYSYYYLCNALDSHNVGRGRGGLAKALSRIRAHCTIVSIATDGLFPVQETAAWAPLVPGAEYRCIQSDFGHDGFLLETEQLSSILEPLLCKY